METTSKLEKRVKTLERDVRRVKAELEMTAPADPLSWPEFSQLDKTIIQLLLQKGIGRGMTTTELAEATKQENLHSGRVIMWRRLKSIMKKSKARTGYPIVVSENKSWHMNFDEFTFIIPKKRSEVDSF